MRTRTLHFVAALVAVVIIGTVFAPAAWAGCADGRPMPRQGMLPSGAAFHGVSFVQVDTPGGLAAIVGLWQVTFVAQNSPGIPDGTVVDAGYATWHSDGTEIMNSGRAPMTSSFCMGVWKQTGRSRYKLSHVALSWDPSGQNFVGPAAIKEEVTVDPSENSYAGSFTIDQFDTSGNVIAHVQGRVTGQRITVQ